VLRTTLKKIPNLKKQISKRKQIQLHQKLRLKLLTESALFGI